MYVMEIVAKNMTVNLYNNYHYIYDVYYCILFVSLQHDCPRVHLDGKSKKRIRIVEIIKQKRVVVK